MWRAYVTTYLYLSRPSVSLPVRPTNCSIRHLVTERTGTLKNYLVSLKQCCKIVRPRLLRPLFRWLRKQPPRLGVRQTAFTRDRLSSLNILAWSSSFAQPLARLPTNRGLRFFRLGPSAFGPRFTYFYSRPTYRVSQTSRYTRFCCHFFSFDHTDRRDRFLDCQRTSHSRKLNRLKISGLKLKLHVLFWTVSRA